MEKFFQKNTKSNFKQLIQKHSYYFKAMHISEGILSPAVLIGGAAFAAAGVAIGLKNLEQKEIPTVGILSAAFFVASLIHVPAGPVTVWWG
jgi:ABC-type Co2+ transport system permease subunit